MSKGVKSHNNNNNNNNNNIKFIAVNFGEDLYNLNNLRFINLHVNFDLSFVESKKAFTNELNNFIKLEFIH